MRKRSGQVYSRESSATLQLTVSLLYHYYKLTVEDYLKNGYNEDTAQIEALKELQKKFSIYFKEVTEDDCV